MGDVLAKLRVRKMAELTGLVKRPVMWSATGRELQGDFLGLLTDLGTIDDRDEEIKTVLQKLDRYGKLGVAGAFEAVFGKDGMYTGEVASVFAAAASGLDYLQPERLLSALEWKRLLNGLRKNYDEADARKEDVLAQFGEPSLVADGRVLCYVNESAVWVFFDCWEDVPTVYDEEAGHFRRGQVENPLLRNVRVPAPNFNESLVLTKYGKNLRWGPGWRLHHQRDDDYPDGVREQLISIDDDDPSQSLGLRRP